MNISQVVLRLGQIWQRLMTSDSKSGLNGCQRGMTWRIEAEWDTVGLILDVFEEASEASRVVEMG